MGFFAGELATILSHHLPHPSSSPWSLLSRQGVHPQQIDRLKKASEEISLIASLPEATILQLRSELELTTLEFSRLQAALEADVFLRLLIYHSYPMDEAVNKANAVFAATLKDMIASGGSEHVFPPLSGRDQQGIETQRLPNRPGRRRKAAPEEIR